MDFTPSPNPTPISPTLLHRISTSNILHSHHLSRLAETQRQEYAHRQRLLQLSHTFAHHAQTALHNQELQHRRGVLEQERDLVFEAQSALQTQEFLHRRRVLKEEIALRGAEGEGEGEGEHRRRMGEVEKGLGDVGGGEVEMVGIGDGKAR